MIIEDMIITLVCCMTICPVNFADPAVLTVEEIHSKEFICPNCGKTLLLYLSKRGRIVNIQQEVMAA